MHKTPNKKTSPKSNKKAIPKELGFFSSHEMSGEMRGLILLGLSLALMLSLISFGINGIATKNWFGALGNTIGLTLTTLFGLSSYLIIPPLATLGIWQLLKRPLEHLSLQVFWMALCLISTSMLLSLFEEMKPESALSLSQTFYPGLIDKKIRYHLGGAPFSYILRDLPFFSLLYIFNALGVGLIFSCTLMASLLFLFRLNPLLLCVQALSLIRHAIDFLLKKPSQDNLSALPKEEIPAAITSLPKEKEPVSDFLRYVKLRIPGFQGQQTPGATHLQSQNEMLAIQPESNPIDRPSLSRKVQTEKAQKDKLQTDKFIERQIEPFIAPQKPQESKPVEKAPSKREVAIIAQKVHNGDFSNFKIPTSALLTNPKKPDHSSLKKDLKRKAEVLEETLLSFGIEAKVGQINCGPTITSFEVHPSIGVKVQKIKTLENDIALNMEAKSIRIIAPIPGKAAVGIEVPNAHPEEVGFKDMLLAYQQGAKKFHIPILLGKAVNGDYVMSDLAKMPHCIIAGATGSGKSVCINTIVMSILLNAKPDEIKLVMVDPKKVELTPYSKLPHMLAPVITEPHGACAALNWMVKEMEKRYEILKLIGVRNIEAFNTRVINKEFEATLDKEIPERLPFIVGIIDELADLMMVSSSDIETPIARIAQMARAVGLHLILATQRPSREVITGLIKANFPTRISFKVSSRVNSQIVLDDNGAESLLGNGDMLFLPPGASHLMRAQGAFIRDEDINAVVKAICDQAPPRYVIESFDKIGFELSDKDMQGEDPGDALYSQALETVLGTGNASTTFLQRKLKVGYARAASLIDMLEQRGIVGPAEGAKPRKILAGKSSPVSSDLEDPVDVI